MTQTILKLKQATALSILCLASLSFTAKAQQVISLQQAVDLTLQNNLTIKQAQINRSTGYRRLQPGKIQPVAKLNRKPAGRLLFW